MDSPASWPLDSPDTLAEALREQDATPAEIAEWMPVAQRLAEWPERTITSADTLRLLSVLAPLLPSPSPLRQALRERRARRRGSLITLLDTIRTQVSILRPAFWLASALITLAGVYVELAPWDNDSVLFLRALGPLLAYLGISSAFRGIGLRTHECELACPPSALQLTLARLVIVLGYDVVLGLCLSLALWLHGLHDGSTFAGSGFLFLTLHWLMPLLLVAGLALVLSLRLPSNLAATLAYGAWLGMLAVAYAVPHVLAHAGVGVAHPLSDAAEIALGVAGLALLAIGTARFPGRLPGVMIGA
jgi:hypothetical protein